MIINADCLEFIKTLEKGSFDAVITDPPYNQEAHGRGLAGKKEIYKAMSEWTRTDNDWYNDSFLQSLMDLCKFPNMFLFCGRTDLFNILNFANKRGLVAWVLSINKSSPMPFLDNTWMTGELGVHITDRKLTYSKRYEDKIPYFMVGGRKETTHPNEKDLKMCERIVRNITPEGGRVFDAFCGSGTIPLACVKQGREFVACELNKEFCKMAEERIERERAQLNLF